MRLAWELPLAASSFDPTTRAAVDYSIERSGFRDSFAGGKGKPAARLAAAAASPGMELLYLIIPPR
jgi:hypothetical protein